MNKFRVLRADEIDCRIAQIKKDGSGLSLLLYKDARCDQNILDETVGPMNWMRHHTRDNRNCIVSIWDAEKGIWIEKEDTGTESNTEREKGLASDSFKRACFNWGIGRELYTAPFIWITSNNCNISKDLKCFDRFTVQGIGYTDGVITGLRIKNQKTGKICFTFGEITEEAPEKPEKPDDEPEAEAAPKPNNTVPSVPPVQEVKAYIDRELLTMAAAYGFDSPEIALKKFTVWRKSLIEGGVIPNTKKITSIDEARNTFDAIYKNFAPSEGESA